MCPINNSSSIPAIKDKNHNKKMTNKLTLIVLLVLFLVNNCAIALECSDGEDCTVHKDNDEPHIQEIALRSAEKPQALSMIQEDQAQVVFQPTVPTTTTQPGNSSKAPEEQKGRSLNFTVDNSNRENNLAHNHSSFDKYGDLSDVNMDNDDEDITNNDEVNFAKILTSKHAETGNSTLGGRCEKGGLTYEEGEKLESGCDSICTCRAGKMDCVDRCSGPYFRKGKKLDDPLCKEKEVNDPCCAILVCAADTETEPLEMCIHKNKTYSRGEQIKEGCGEVCLCEAAGKVNCKPRCVPVNKTSDRCVEIPDPTDPCCKKVLCDVSLDDHEHEKEAFELKNKLLSARFLNTTAIELRFERPIDKANLPSVEVSTDRVKWTPYNITKSGILTNVNGQYKYVMVQDTGDVVDIMTENPETKFNGTSCNYKGVARKLHEEFHDECESFCICQETGVKCLKLECPTYFGVDILDPHCIEWETYPANFTATPPKCCPEKLVCKNNGSCEFEGKTYQNWQQVPENVTGCDKRCFCEMGNIECQSTCPPVPALPPHNLGCPQSEAMLGHLEDDQCCLYWTCSNRNALPGENVTVISKDVNGANKNKTKTITPDSNNKTLVDPFTYQFTTKPPTKILGPLLVYTNKEPNETAKEPIEVDENHYHKEQNKPDTVVVKEESKVTKHSDSKTKDSKPTISYAGPFNPDFKPPPSKNSNKNSKTKPSKGSQMFVTPPPPPPPRKAVIENDIPEVAPILPTTKPHIEDPLHNSVRIHAKGDPHEILQIINQHPEIANYPPGSVLEIHNIDPSNPKKPPFINPNSIVSPNVRQPVVPFVINQNHPQEIPPGVGLEQFLEELHKNIHPQQTNAFVPYPNNNNNQYANDGQIFIQPPQQPNNPIFNTRPQRNLTQQSGHVAQLFPGGFPNYPGFQAPQEEINVHVLEPIDAHTVRLAFTIPPIIVGLHGRVEVRYTNTLSEDTNTWRQQILAPPNDLISTPQLEFDLVDLDADSEYKIKISIMMRDFSHAPTSRVYTIKTPKDSSVSASNLPATLPIEPEMAITDINSTWVNVVWRKFRDNELQFIDGVQLRFKEIDGKVYMATPLIHRAVTSHLLENLKPNTKYEIGIFFIPFPGQHTELHAEHMLHFTTANEVDTYGFNVSMEITHVKPTSVEITWSGVPYPEDKYVNIYRAIYQSDSGKGDYSTFKVAKRDSPSKTTIMDLKPGTRYRLWLEVYLTNGKIKTSNVQDFITKPRSLPALGAATKQDKLSLEYLESRGDYYGPLVVVAILAAVAILCTIILLLILVRRHSQNKAAITPPTRVSQSAYDNPTYKVEIQQETMNL